jgi:phage shock protein A
MAERDLSGLGGVRLDGPWGRAEHAEGTLHQIRQLEERVVALRREAVVAVVRQEEIATRLVPLAEQSGRIEGEATAALAEGSEVLARQILHRELATLALRDAVQEELVEARRTTIRLLKDAARLDDRARWARREVEAARPGSAAIGPARQPEATS